MYGFKGDISLLHALCTTIAGYYIATPVITYTVFQGTQNVTMFNF